MGHAKVDTTLNVYTQVIDGSKGAAAREIAGGLITIDHKPEKGGPRNVLKHMAPQAGLEPATLRLTEAALMIDRLIRSVMKMMKVSDLPRLALFTSTGIDLRNCL